MTPLRILHAIHDFLPRHRAGAEIYADALAREQSRAHLVHVLCAEYAPERPHGALAWRVHDRLPVIEIANNWAFSSFEETYASPAIDGAIEHALDAVEPDVVHIHSLLNLSFNLPRIAAARGIATVATLHDYTLVCPSGGQRVHLAERHVCEPLDPDRCRRCFPQSAQHAQMALASLTGRPGILRAVASAARAVRRLAPRAADRAAAAMGRASRGPLSAAAVAARLERAREVFDLVDLFVAPSGALAAEFGRLGIAADKLEVSDYGLPAAPAAPREPGDRLRIGFAGTLAWHKGAHVLIEAARALPPARFDLSVWGDTALSPAYVAALRERARGLPVRFPGAFERARQAEVYAALDVLVVPSLWLENSPLVIHEAFLAGVPVVGARRGGIPELVRDESLLYDPGSPAELASILRRLIDEPERLRRLSAVPRAVKPIGQDAAEWEDRYRGVLARAGQGRAARRARRSDSASS